MCMRVYVCVCTYACMFVHVCLLLPEWSSLTNEDTVLVMESAATRRSFLRFLLGAEKHKSHIMQLNTEKKTIIK